MYKQNWFKNNKEGKNWWVLLTDVFTYESKAIAIIDEKQTNGVPERMDMWISIYLAFKSQYRHNTHRWFINGQAWQASSGKLAVASNGWAFSIIQKY